MKAKEILKKGLVNYQNEVKVIELTCGVKQKAL
jgi:hypothetical protein